MLSFRASGRTHTGLVRADNEDAALVSPLALVVADGIGGQAAGEVASGGSVRLAAAATAPPDTGPHPDVDPGPTDPEPTDPEATLRAVVADTHDQLRRAVAADPTLTGTSTTFTALVGDGTQVVMLHVGDSRAYRLRAGDLTQLSHDHTLVQSMVDAGKITTAQARESFQRNILLRALGAERVPDPDVETLDLRAGDRVLLCSDGLSDLVVDAEIAALLGAREPVDAADALVAAALDAGGSDNVTAVVADVVDAARPGPADRAGVLLGAARESGPDAVRGPG